MASDALIGRNVGGSLPRVAAAMASAVIGLPTGPTDMMMSTLLSRIAWLTLFGSNWTTLILSLALGLAISSELRIAIFSGAIRYCRRITFNTSILRGERPTTPRRLPTICSIFSIGLAFGAFFPLAGFAGSSALGTMNTTTFLRRIATT